MVTLEAVIVGQPGARSTFLLPRVIVTIYTPGIGDGPDENSTAVWAGETHLEVPCWGGCDDGTYDPTSGTPDAGFPCVECRGTGRRIVWLL